MSGRKGVYGGKDPRDIPSYSVAQAAGLVGVPASTLRAWVAGRTREGRRSVKAIIRPAEPAWLSFTNLVEAHVLSAMRKDYQLKLDVIRRAARYVETELEVEHPLAREEFSTDGVGLFVERFGKLVNVSREGQIAIRQAIEVRLERVEYRGKRAERMFPLLRKAGTLEAQPRLIVVDPRFGFGRPVLSGTGIPVSVIRERFDAGESCSHLAKDYGVSVESIEEAVRAA